VSGTPGEPQPGEPQLGEPQPGEPQCAWIAIDQGAVVTAADGSDVGTVKEIAGDETRDIFDGLVVDHSRFDSPRYIAAERVKGIWPDRVETDLTAAEAGSLQPYSAPKVTEWHADDDTGFGARVRRAWHALLGKRS
jgi:hypothetical protein